MTREEAIRQIEKAHSAKGLFGPDPAKLYHQFAKLLHPDVAKGNVRAEEAFLKATKFYESLNGKPSSTDLKIIGKWAVGDPVAKGDIADLYECEHLKTKEQGVFKLARSEGDTDLMEQECFALRYLHSKIKTDNFRRYLPKVLDSLDAGSRRATVLARAEQCFSLAQIVDMYPRGVDFRHIVWFGNRALNALGAAHDLGILHGAVLPDHLLFRPHDHGLILADWCYSVTAESKKHIPAIVKKDRSLYPVEVQRKASPGPGTDIFMLMRCLKWAAGSIPKRFKGLFDHCLAESIRSRPNNAWTLVDKWLALAKEEYGPPTFIPLEVKRQ